MRNIYLFLKIKKMKKFNTSAWLRLSNWLLEDYKNSRIFFYKYPIQFIFRYVRLYKYKTRILDFTASKQIKRNYLHKINYINLKDLKNKENKNKVFLKLYNGDNDQMYYDQLNIFLRNQKKIIPIFTKNTINDVQISSPYDEYSFKSKNIPLVQKIYINSFSIIEFFFYLPFVSFWLLRRKRYICLIKSCLYSWLRFIKIRKIYYFYYSLSNIKELYFSYSAYGNESEISALNLLGIKVIEIIHAHIHKDHFGYNRYFYNYFEKDIFTPNNIIGPKKYKNFFRKPEFYIISENFLNFDLDYYNEKFSPEENILIFGSVEESKEIYNFIIYNAIKKYNKIFYLPHPRNSSSFINSLKKFKVRIFKKNLFNVMDQCNYFLVTSSTMIMYLMKTKKVVYVLSTKKQIARYLSIESEKIPKNFLFRNDKEFI